MQMADHHLHIPPSTYAFPHAAVAYPMARSGYLPHTLYYANIVLGLLCYLTY